jgi:hypothetical protein
VKKIKLICTNIYVALIPILGGLLGALGGVGEKSLRRILIPILIMGLAYSKTDSILVMTIGSMMVVLSIGYGIPCGEDEGSKLGAFFYNLFHQNETLANIFTRGVIGALIALSLISIPIIRKNWLIYLWFGLSIIMVNAFLSWRNFGSYHLFGKELSWVETIVWGLITLCAILIIKIND